MKYLKKTLAVFLAILTMLSIMSTATSVFAAEYTENKIRTEYFDSTLSGYLKNIVDTDGAIKIAEKEKIEAEKETKAEMSAKTFSMRKASTMNTETEENSDTDVDIDHTRLTLDLGDGENTAYLFSEPISFINKSGELVYKDTNIKSVTDADLISQGYTYENGNNDYKVYFSADSSKGVLIVTEEGYRIKLVPNGEKSNGDKSQVEIDCVQNDAFTYPNAYGTDTLLRFLPQLNGLKDEIVLDSYKGQNSFCFTLDVVKNVAAINSRGEVEIIDSETKEIIQTFAVPFAYDAVGGEDETSDHYTACTYLLEKEADGKYILSINVPEEYLTSENTVYPVTIDPTTSNISNSYDSAIYSSKRTTPQYANETFCVGRTVSSQYGRGRGLVYFKIPSDIKKYALISEAKYWVRETTGRTDTMYVVPHPLKEDWDNNVTWETRPSWRATFSYPGKTGLTLGKRNINSKSTDNPDNSYWYAFNITNAVRAWTTGTANQGLIFCYEKEDSESTSDYQWRAFASKEHSTSARRPYAVIKYTNDTKAPTISSVSGNPTEWTKSNVTLKVTATDNVYGASGIASYSFDNGSTWQTSNSKPFSSNQTVNIKVKDLAGNISAVKTENITKIDKTKPAATITLTPTSWTNGNVTATIKMTDNAALKSYKIGSDAVVSISGTAKTVTKTYSADATVSVTVTDAAGNTATASKSFTNIDKIKPVIKSVSGNPTAWTKNDVTLTVTATDEESGIGGYSFDNGATWQTTNSKAFNKNQTVNIKVKDKAGNISAATTVAISKIDKTVPTASASCEATSAGVRITVTASDSQSGLSSTPYSYNNGAWTNQKYFDVKTQDAVSIRVRDAVGNIKTLSYTPNPVEPITVDVSPSEWTNEDVILNVSGTGLSKYKFDANEWQEQNTYTVSENKSVAISVEDKFAMQKELDAVEVTNIDKDAPIINAVAFSETNYTKEPVTITVGAEDSTSGIKEYSFDGGESWQASSEKVFDENTANIVIAVKDNANNISYYKDDNGTAQSVATLDEATVLEIKNIDSTKPDAPDIFTENGLVYLSLRPSNEATETAEHLEYRIGEGGEWTAYEDALSLVNTYDVTVYARVCDEAGNQSEVSSTVVKSTLGEYTAGYNDIAYGEGVFPVPFERTYSSTDGWFFSFEANVAPCTNGYVFTDFTGEKHHFIKDDKDKFMSADGDELVVTKNDDDSLAGFELPYNDLTCKFNKDGKLVSVVDGDRTFSYVRIGNKMRISEVATQVENNGSEFTNALTDGVEITTAENENNYTVSVVASKPEVESKIIEYIFEKESFLLTQFTDAANIKHNYSYINGLLTQNDTETIDYAENGRVKRITQKNGAFVKYTYNDTAKENEASTEPGAVTVSDGRGVTDTLYYANGFTVSSTFDNYTDNAIYAPESISNELTDDVNLSDIAYVIKEDAEENSNTVEEGASDASGVEADSDAEQEEYPLYDKDDEGNYTFYKYDENHNIIEQLEVKTGTLYVTEETTFDDALAACVTKEVYGYEGEQQNFKAIYQRVYGDLRQVYSEQYTYGVYGQTTHEEKTKTSYSLDESTNTVIENTIKRTIDYEYDGWGQCIKTTEDANTDKQKIRTVSYDELGRETYINDGTVETKYVYSKVTGRLIETIVNSEKTEYTYYNGNMQYRYDPNGMWAYYLYDEFGNLKNHIYNGYSFDYNTLGSITRMYSRFREENEDRYQRVEYTYSPDVNQEILNAHFSNKQDVDYLYNDNDKISEVKFNDSTMFSYSYDENDVTTVTYAGNNIVKTIEENKTTVEDNKAFVYSTQEAVNEDGDVSSKVNTIGDLAYSVSTSENTDTFATNGTTDFVKSFKYDDFDENNVSKTEIGGVYSSSYDYNLNNVIYRLLNKLNNETQSYTYEYDSNGNITAEYLNTVGKGEQGETVESSEKTEYEYTNNQLIRAENSNTKWLYTYDARGNILSKEEYAVTLDENGEKVYTLKENGADSYTYSKGWLDELEDYNGQKFTYDDSGNPTLYKGTAMSWTMGRQLAKYGNNTYTYNEEGIRTSKTVDGVTTKYYLDGTNIIYQTNGTDNLYFFYDSKDSIVGFKYNDNNYYYVKNLQGDITDIVDADGNIVANYEYDPWGEVISVSGSNLELANLNPFRYRSYYYDSDTELYYLQSRYYDPEIGRFINCDNINYIGTQNTVVSYNPFAYCENEPIDYYDPSGNGPILIGTLIGLAVGGIAGAVASYIYKGKVKVSWIVGGMTVGALIGAGIGWIYTTFKGAAASWMAYRAAQISSGASTASSSIGRMFEKWYYGYNKIGKGLQQVTQKINGVTCRFDAIKSGKIIELKNYDWSKYKSYKSIISSFTNQANKYRQFIGRTIHRQKITGIKFYFSSKPPKAIINALKKIGVSVGWVK